MAEPELRVEDAHGVRTLTLNRPARRNALSPGLVHALTGAVRASAEDPGVHVLVVTGAGKSFCAGGDLQPSGVGSGPLRMHEDREAFVALLDAFERSPKPIVARIQGPALGGGFGLALACHLSIAAESATLGTPEVRLGLFPMMILPLIVRHVGRKRAAKLVLCGEKMSATEALECGCLSRVVPDDELDATLREVVKKLRSFSPAVHRLGLDQLRAASELPLQDGASRGSLALGLNLLLEDAGEGIMAFLAKRPPKWKGR